MIFTTPTQITSPGDGVLTRLSVVPVVDIMLPLAKRIFPCECVNAILLLLNLQLEVDVPYTANRNQVRSNDVVGGDCGCRKVRSNCTLDHRTCRDRHSTCANRV